MKGAMNALAWMAAAALAMLAAKAPAQVSAGGGAAAPAAQQPDWTNPDHATFEWLAAHPNPFVAADSVDAPLASRRWLDCSGMWAWFGRQCAGLKGAWYQGRATWYASGYAWHIPGTWEEDRLKELNQKAWGAGYGFARTDERGDNYGWYVLAFKDSHFNVTTVAGWSAITYWPATADVAVGLGYSAFIMMRPDIAKGWPFPAALPLASVKFHGAEVIGSFIPKVNGGVNHGDVAYFFARYQF
jgi:palmitoyl transferase